MLSSALDLTRFSGSLKKKLKGEGTHALARAALSLFFFSDYPRYYTKFCVVTMKGRLS